MMKASIIALLLFNSCMLGSFHHAASFDISTKANKLSKPNTSLRVSFINEEGPMTSPQITVKDLRQVEVTDVDGKMVQLGDFMSRRGPSVVVFLRHLGCTWCWSYVYQWKTMQKELHDAGIESPIFVSIGDKDRLNSFLLKNPDIPRDRFFVDGYDFTAFKEAGFERFDEKPKSVTEGVKPKPAEFGSLKGWWTFISSFIPLAPVTPDMKFPENLTPEGLFWVGGTFVIKDNQIIYRWDDRISGDHPEAQDVVEIAKSVSSRESSSQFTDILSYFSKLGSGR